MKILNYFFINIINSGSYISIIDRNLDDEFSTFDEKSVPSDVGLFFNPTKKKLFIKRFKNCLKTCIKEKIVEVKWVDKLMKRSKKQKVRILCHHHCILNTRNFLHIKNIKRNGRWSFYLIFGISEFVSSIFSLLGLILNIRFFTKTLSYKVKHSKNKNSILLHYYASNFTFLSSFLFHVHQSKLTRNADYFSAIFSIVIYTTASVDRVFIRFGFNNSYNILVSIFLFICHISYLIFVDFNYMYNKVFCGVLFFISTICYLLIYIFQKDGSNSDILILRKKIEYFILLIILTGLFEVTDFPPLFYLFDSHALWHIGIFLTIEPYHDFQSKELDIIIQTKIIKQEKIKINIKNNSIK